MRCNQVWSVVDQVGLKCFQHKLSVSLQIVDTSGVCPVASLESDFNTLLVPN